MMIIKTNLQKLLIMGMGLLIGISSCKKDPASVTTRVEPPPVATSTREELTKDSIFLYAKDTYYWNDGIPAYDVFKPRSYASNEALLDAIRALPGLNKPFWTTNLDPTPREKYSFLDDGAVSAELGGISGDYGFSVFYNGPEGSSDVRIKYVSPNSPAAKKGLKRGYRITKLNDKTDFDSSVDANVTFVGDAVFGANSNVSLTVEKPDGQTEDVTITRANYATTPIFHTQIYTVGAKKIGYIVYNSFTTNSGNALTSKFAEFAAAGVSELIVDLRYNGGGSVSTSDALVNLIAPASATGSLMYTTYWTKTMQDGKADILSNQPLPGDDGKLQYGNYSNGLYATYADIDYSPTEKGFNVERFAKSGSANFNKVYFLVLSGTASASELLINNLKPVMDVKLIGRPTYGKPVGFFAIHIDKLDLYIPQFETKNSLNVGGYYTGLAVDYSIADDVTKDFGDENEALLAAALNYSEKGTFAAKKSATILSSTKAMSVSDAKELTTELDKHKFKGMIDDRPKLRRGM